MKRNPAGDLYKKMAASLGSDMSDKQSSGFFARGGLQQNVNEPATRVQKYFKRIRQAREDFNNARTNL